MHQKMIIVMSDKAGSLVDQQEENKLISGYHSRSHNENTSWKEALLTGRAIAYHLFSYFISIMEVS